MRTMALVRPRAGVLELVEHPMPAPGSSDGAVEAGAGVQHVTDIPSSGRAEGAAVVVPK